MGSRKIPGFASPPHDGFAVFADRTATTDLAAALFDDHRGLGHSSQWDESPSWCVPEPTNGPATRREGSACLDDLFRMSFNERLVDVRIAAQDAAVGQQRLDRSRIQRPCEVEALGELAA
jgi:hypothetical protein